MVQKVGNNMVAIDGLYAAGEIAGGTRRIAILNQIEHRATDQELVCKIVRDPI